jgi:Protein of unknown function (DUF2628)
LALYSVHLKGNGQDSVAEAEFVHQAFDWQAFFFGPLWLVQHRLWMGLLVWAAAYFVLAVAVSTILPASTGFLIAVYLQILLGLEASRLCEAKLAVHGYHLAEIIAAPALDQAASAFYHRFQVAGEAPGAPP